MSTPDATPLRIHRIRIEKLFRQYDHDIKLNLNERVTILHGRNGIGKTVTLSLIDAIRRGDYDLIARTLFSRIIIDCDHGESLEIKQIDPFVNANIEPDKKAKLKGKLGRYGFLSVRVGSGTIESRQINLTQGYLLYRGEISAVSFYEQALLDSELNSILDDDYSIRNYPLLLDKPLIEPPELMAFRQRLPPVHIVGSDRLAPTYREEQKENAPPTAGATNITSAIQTMATDLAVRIQRIDSLYRETSLRLDDTLPNRLFTRGKTVEPASSPAELQTRTRALDEERARLRMIGLLEDTPEPFEPASLEPAQLQMFSVYLRDNEQKIRVFRDLADQAEQLVEIINRKFAPKRVRLHKDEGLQVFSPDGRPLELEKLSSGEQHELVLLHNMLFMVERNSLLLIDEPELSLHVTWQNEFLADLLKIAATVHIDVLIATHSPYIVGDYSDLLVQLGTPV